jgi:hypothetical protein
VKPEKLRDEAGRRFRGWAVVNPSGSERVSSADPNKLVEHVYEKRPPEWREVEVSVVYRERRRGSTRAPAGLTIVGLSGDPRIMGAWKHEDQIHMTAPLLTAEEGEQFRLAADDWFLTRIEDPGSGGWWVSARGAMERAATLYEELRPELAPRKGWRLAPIGEVEAIVDARRKGLARLESELEEEERMRIEGAARRAVASARLHREFCEARARKFERAAKKAREREARAEKKLAKILQAATGGAKT